MSEKKGPPQKDIEELSFETLKAIGFNRARAIAVRRRCINSKRLPTDLLLTEDDFRCDAEQVEIDRSGTVRKSPPPTITKP